MWIAWEFIKEEIKKDNSRIQFPFDVHMILSINIWANGFVHTTFIYSSYIQFYALKAIKVLFTPAANHIVIYNGTRQNKYNVAEIRITNYNSLKNDFEKYLKEKITDLVVDWQDMSRVGAYIMSL